MQLIFKTVMLICQSKAMLDVDILFSKVAHHLNLRIKKVLVRGFHGNKTCAFDHGQWFVSN